MPTHRIRWGNVATAVAAVLGLILTFAWLQSGEDPPPLPPPVHIEQPSPASYAASPVPAVPLPRRRERRHRRRGAQRRRHPVRAEARGSEGRMDPQIRTSPPMPVAPPPKPEFGLGY
jgi:hypothetical protein